MNETAMLALYRVHFTYERGWWLWARVIREYYECAATSELHARALCKAAHGKRRAFDAWACYQFFPRVPQTGLRHYG